MAPSTPYSEVSNSSCTSICYKFLLFSLYRNSACTSPFNSFLTTVCSTPSCTSFKFLPRFNLSLLLPPNLLQFFLRRASNSSCTSIYRNLFPPFAAILFPPSPSFSPSSTSWLFFHRLRLLSSTVSNSRNEETRMEEKDAITSGAIYRDQCTK